MGAIGSLVLPIILLLIPACGRDEGVPPVLTGISQPKSVWRFLVGFPFPDDPSRGGVGTPTWTVDFEDPDGDVVLMHVRWQDCGRGSVKELDSIQEDLRKATSGSIRFSAVISTDCPVGTYTVRVSVSDGQGHTSNVLEVPYEIYE